MLKSWIRLPTRLRGPGRKSVALILVFVALIAIEPAISRGLRSAGIALETVPGGGPRPLSLLTPDPHRSVIDMDWRDGGLEADLYDPGGLGRKPGLILLNGVVREGRRYGELVNLVQALSRAGFVVMVPDLLSYSRFRLVPDDIDVLAQAFEFLADHKAVDPRRVGFVGFSVGGSLAFVAAAEDRISDEVSFVAMIGPYSDLDRVIMEVTTTSYSAMGNRSDSGLSRSYGPLRAIPSLQLSSDRRTAPCSARCFRNHGLREVVKL